MKGLITKSTGKWYDVKINNKIYKTILRGKLKINNQLTKGENQYDVLWT